MKNSFLQDNQQKFSRIIWILFHLLILLGAFTRGSFSINTNLFDILSPSHSMQTVAEADKIMSEKSSRNIIILVSHEDFSVAKNAIEELYANFKGSPAFEGIELYFDSSVVNQISDYIFANRYTLLNQQTRSMLNAGQEEILAGQALSIIYSPFTITGLKYFNQDPFMLTESQFQGFLSSSLAGSTAMSPKENILCAYQEGKWYAMLQGSLTKEATAITERGGIIPALKEFSQTKEESVPGLDFIFSGVPFHSFESSTNAQREISLISTISLIIVLVLLILTFKSLLPVVASLVNITISTVVAVAAVLLFYGEMHIMSLVFGTTLIGLGVDYSIHFFIAQRKGTAQNGKEALSCIFKGITFGFVSTQICFVLLFLAPFPILKQIATFLSFGLLSTYLSVVCLYPYLVPCKKEKWRQKATKPLPSLPSGFRAGILLLLLVLPTGVIIFRWQDIKVENNLAQLYTMSPELTYDEMTSAQVLDHGSSGWYYIVVGRSQDELLQNEETLCLQLDKEIMAGKLSSYLATSLFVPSSQRQEESHAAAQNLIRVAPQHLASLGFSQQEAEDFISDLQEPPSSIDIERDLPPYIRNALENLWLGELDGYWYSVVMPLHTTEEAVFRQIATSNPNVFFANLTKDVGTELNSLTRIMLILMAIALVMILLVLKRWYTMKEVIRIGCIPVFIFITTTALLSICNMPISFFSVAALLLVFGTGIDYIIYTLEAEKDNKNTSTSLATFLSYGTTAMSFGALSLTSFAPVHIFGLTVLIGLSAAYICSLLLKRQPSPRNREASDTENGATAVST